MIQTFDWNSMLSTLRNEIISITGIDASKVIIDGYSGEKPNYPFVTINAHYNTIRDGWMYSPTDEQFETTVSINVMSNIKSQAGHVMDDLQAVLREYSAHKDLKDSGIVLIDVLNPSNRTSIGTLSSDYQFGFDLQLRLRRSFDSTTPQFDEVETPTHSIKTNEEGQ